MQILGVDIGGSGIKGAIVDTETGILLTDRHRIDTPKPPTPAAIAEVVNQLSEHFNWEGVIGCGFPAAIQQGVVRTASNISKTFLVIVSMMQMPLVWQKFISPMRVRVMAWYYW